MNATVVFMDLAAFQSEGYLQEVNRRFFHPLGLALALVSEEDGTPRCLQVYDDRADIEGWEFVFESKDGAEEARHKAEKIAAAEALRRPLRETALGFWVQPIPADAPATPQRSEGGE